MSDDLERLRDEVGELRAQVTALKAQLDASRTAEAPTMKARMRCPACGSARIAHAKDVLGIGGRMALAAEGTWSAKFVGHVEAFACTGCGLVEWYVADPGALHEVKGHLSIVDGDAVETGPYR